MQFWGLLYRHGLTLTPASNYILYKMWYGITYPFPNLNGCFWEWISNFIPQLIGYVIIMHTGINVNLY